ncbi:zinc finger BED domain-containing DAYSLEEPER [Brachionus plicatilis]|uniref:Zinc finger BED domain-containing DAYSLEEPER n=1 Tax=Brachionus plicatilis TaxID=10195 RepID=A0A3M7R6G7_BRAPC|nr:zinc finger BED domain-containing DAYSLEEPER [Brachionus plicatilis]
MDSSIKRKYFVPGLYQKHRRMPKILNNYDFDTSYLQKPRENFSAKCKLCGKTVRASMRVTTNFVNHVKKFHPSSQADSFASVLSEDRTLPTPPQHQLNALDVSIVSALIKCSVPLAVLHMSAFSALLNQLNPEVDTICPSSVNNDIIPHLVEQTRLQLMDLLSQASSTSLLLDYWSLEECQYVCLYASFVDQEWSQRTVMLHCQKISKIEDVNSAVQHSLNEYNLQHRVYSLCLTSSSGLALQLLLENLSLNCEKFISCSLLLEKIVSDGLKKAAPLSQKKLALDKLLDLKPDLDADNESTNDLVSLFKPFNELKSDLEKDAASISVIYPAFKGLQTHLSLFRESRVHDVAKELEKWLEERLGFVRSIPVFSIAAMLNPNFGLSWMDEEEHSQNEKMLASEFLKEAKVYREQNDVKDVKINVPRRKSYLCLSRTIGADNEYSNELNSYIMYVKAFSYDENFRLLDFWRSNEKTYPNLSSFVKKILPASIGLANRDKLAQDFMQKMELKNELANVESILFVKFNNS